MGKGYSKSYKSSTKTAAKRAAKQEAAAEYAASLQQHTVSPGAAAAGESSPLPTLTLSHSPTSTCMYVPVFHLVDI